jgi:hypothetical protein
MAGLRDYIQTIYEDNGRLTPALVVQTARPVDHPLHPFVFNKGPAEAAEAYYLDRARDLIAEVTVVYKEADEHGPAMRVRAWQSVRSKDGPIFESSEKVAADPMLARAVLNEMEREYRSLEARFGHFEEFVALAQGTVKKARRKAA